MPNIGNTGQHWKLSTLVSVEVQGDKVVYRLSCGHAYESGTSYVTSEEACRLAQKRIGKRQGCRECSK